MKRYQQVIFITTIFSLLTTQVATGQDSTRDALTSCDNTLPRVSSAVKSINKLREEKNAGVNNDTKPSLWWATEQFDPFDGRLVENWLADSKVQQINLVVNWQLWTLLDYLGRYRFVNQFGTVARKYGYNLNIFNQKNQCLATYKYNPISKPPKWEINLEQLGQNSLQIEPTDLINTK